MTREKLQRVYHLNNEIKMWQRELEKLKGKSLAAAPATDSTPSGGMPGDRVGNYVAQKADIEKIIEGQLEEVQLARTEILNFIHDIPDSLTRQIVFFRSCSLMSWSEIAKCISTDYPAENARQIYSRFIKQLPKA